MSIEDRKRFCSACQKHVHDLSAMTETDAQAFLDRSDDDVCVSYLRDDEGALQFRPTSVVPVGRLLRRPGALAKASLAAVLAACAPHRDQPRVETGPEAPAATEPVRVIPQKPAGPVAKPAVDEPCEAPTEPRIHRVKGKRALPLEAIRNGSGSGKRAG